MLAHQSGQMRNQTVTVSNLNHNLIIRSTRYPVTGSKGDQYVVDELLH